jgi:hypothetical protein
VQWDHDPAGANLQPLVPAYFWTNLKELSAVVSVSIVNSCDNWIIENQVFYDYNASFDGTSGVGCGTLATLQGSAYWTSCTAGVGYWATSQSCADLTGMVGANPTTPISGTLYKCNATGNGWDVYYTPYTYPHPLRGESVTSIAAGVVIGGGIEIK